MNALYLRDESKREKAVAKISEYQPEYAQTAPVVFSEFSLHTSQPSNPEQVGNLLYPCAANSFEVIAVDNSIPLFRNSWGKAFLAGLNRSLLSNGSLILPFYPSKIAKHKGYWSLKDLRKFLGCEIGRNTQLGLAAFKRSDTLAPPVSVVNWFHHSHPRAIHPGQFPDLNLPEVRQTVSAMCLHPDRTEEYIRLMRSHLETEATQPELIPKRFKQLIYYTMGISNKHACLDHIIQTHLPRRTDVRFVDHGGGFGMLGIELLLTERIQTAVNCDPSARNLFLSFLLFDFFRDHLNGKYHFEHTKAETFTYPDPVDVICYLVSFLYVPDEIKYATLQRDWDHLRPGGILVIQENIRSETFKRETPSKFKGVQRKGDEPIMFTVEKIDELMGRFGDVRRYMTTAAVPISKEEGGVKLLFRVVQKKE
ncbi:MAG: class I SAM-dependent methyltransferase [Phycisphaerae bacterium]|nr:class I SAM-dependent methyltransferase [Phycisphaerae bacterium]